ncbi:MAG: acetylglutamate kinase [Nitrospirae bacterium]|nr:MAG: acetylglutamate kinase [Nitrospirota bacterium]
MERWYAYPVQKEEIRLKGLIEKAEVLIEALPYIRKFYGKTFVIKYGGAAQKEESLKDAFSQDIILLKYIGINPVVVHGGGPKISETMKKMGKTPTFVQGQRVTDQETMDIVEMVLGGLVNKTIVATINQHGGKAVGLTGKDGGLIRAKRKRIRKKSEKDKTDEIIDLGLVGEVEEVNPDIVEHLDRSGFIPVIAPVGVSAEGETLNINADYVASAVASALKAEKLILLTDVDGVRDAGGKKLSTLKRKKAQEMIKSGIIKEGMIPKVQACLEALSAGVKKTHIIDGRVPHCLLLEIFTEEGVGTEIV